LILAESKVNFSYPICRLQISQCEANVLHFTSV